MQKAQAESLKAQGNHLFKSGDFAAAIKKYDAAFTIDPKIPAYKSNAAACWEKIGNFEKMAEASRACISADKTFVKGYFRLATAQKKLNDLKGCIKTLESGLGINASNRDLKHMKKEVIELQRNEQVAAFCRKAEEQMLSSDVSKAYKTLERASRLDAGNPEIQRMMSRVKPKFERMEARRKAGLNITESHKEKGDDAYKSANFEVAIEHYTRCIKALKAEKKEHSELALKAFSNRAACYKQISNFDGTIEDCTAVIEIDQENVKALVRRAQAFEGVERYRFALQDIKTVLNLPFDKVGKSNFDLCNMMQHRLNRTVQQLKKMG